MKTLLRPALLFIAIGLALYAALYTASEALLMQHGRSHPLFKIAQLREPAVDWVVLGASHAMPLDFDDVNAGLERASGQRIVQLAGPGTGPLYNRFVLEHFLQRHRTRELLYVVDAFAFYSRTWNEERFADAKLLRRTPWDPDIAAQLGRYVRDEGIEPQALLDYASGFSKINNRERCQRDVWEGAAQFERSGRRRAAPRPSASPTSTRTARHRTRWPSTSASSNRCWSWPASTAWRCRSSRCRCQRRFGASCPTKRLSTRLWHA